MKRKILYKTRCESKNTVRKKSWTWSVVFHCQSKIRVVQVSLRTGSNKVAVPVPAGVGPPTREESTAQMVGILVGDSS